MKNRHVCRLIATSTFTVFAASGIALAHGPNIVLTDVGGQIVTNQLDVTPQSDAASTSDYPVGGPARVFPSQYDTSNYNTYSSSSYSANAPSSTALEAIPMVWTQVSGNDSTGNSGFYAQMEQTDAVGNNTLDTGPGYAYGHGGFSALTANGSTPAQNTVFQITFANTLQYFNSSSGTFTATPDGEQLQMIRNGGGVGVAGTGYANALTSNGVQSGVGCQATVTSSQNAGSHSQAAYRLLESDGQSVDDPGTNESIPTSNEITDGVYLATFQIGTATTSSFEYETSLPYYVLFELDQNNDVTPAEVSAAVTAADNIASVPEPASAALIALGGCGLLARRRRKN